MMAVRNSRILGTITLILISVILCPISHGKVIYVDDDATGANNGTSWADSYTFLQDALVDANDSEKPVEIRVAQGIYRPSEGLVAIPEFDWRTTTFQLINGVTLKGGYAGAADPNARDIELYETVLSGDLNGNDVDVNDLEDLPVWQSRAENSYHTVTAYRTDETALLDGFTVSDGFSGGYASKVPTPDVGGGMFNFQSSPIVNNCTFAGNFADSVGGGIYNYKSSPTFTNCTFIGNLAHAGGGMYNCENSPTLTNCRFTDNLADFLGGGMYNESSSPITTGCIFNGNSSDYRGGGMYNFLSSPVLTDCAFSNNLAWYGGGMYNDLSSSPTLTGCTFTDNVGLNDSGGMSNSFSSPILNDCKFRGNYATSGGGIYNSNSSPTLTNCIFSGNSVDIKGGGMWNYESSPVLTNCTFSRNSAYYAGDTTRRPVSNSGGGICNYSSCSPILTNCILWSNTPEQMDGSANVSYSDIEGGWPGNGIGIIDVDPCFADPNNGDYHLKSEAGRWDPNSESWVKDDATSPCIDAGDPNSDWAGEIWPHGGRINMGAYGGTRQASMSLETEGMSLARVAYIYSQNDEVAENFQSLLGAYGCPTTMIRSVDVPATPLNSYDLIIVANDTQHEHTWSDANTVAAIEDSGKPVVGLGDGGYDFYGVLGLSIGSPNGAHGSNNSIEVVDPNSSLFSTPYSIEIPQDQTLQLYTETKHVGLYLWPTIPESVTVLAREANNFPYCSLAIEHNRYLLWTFTESPQKMTEVGKTLFINLVIHTANKAWESDI